VENLESGIVFVQMTIDATSDRAARPAAQRNVVGSSTRRVAGTRPASVHDHLRRGEAEPRPEPVAAPAATAGRDPDEPEWAWPAGRS
jgi:hypothetical protein